MTLMKPTKLMVIALDGATFDLIAPWAKEGELPNMSRLMNQGAYGTLLSTLPPITGAAWASFQTGVNPGRHGIFDWLTRAPNSYRLVPISSLNVKRKTLWEFLSEQGLRVGVIGVPVTYPMKPVNGFMISDLLTPQGANYTFPKELQRELEAQVRYKVAPEHWRGRAYINEWLRGLKEGLVARKEAALYLMKRYDWDFLMVHFMETDSVQHQMWHLIDGVPRAKYRTSHMECNPILEIYRLADAAIGDILQQAKDATVFVISDHGFGPLHNNVYLNNWLLEHGYLALKRNPSTLLKRAAFQLGLTPENLFPLAERLGVLKKNSNLSVGQIHDRLGKFFLATQNINWKRTRAYSYGNVGQIYLNIKGREPQGCVEPQEAEKLINEIIGKLREFKNPETGERVIKEIYRKEEIYTGDLTLAPDILFLPTDGYMAIGTSEFVSNRSISPSFGGSGWHRMEGIFIGAGAQIKQGQLPAMKLVDLFPTIAYALGLPIPADLDGRVFDALFREEVIAHQAKTFVPDETPAEDGLTPAWEKEIKERLRALGYI